jgi:hypothetical protein
MLKHIVMMKLKAAEPEVFENRLQTLEALLLGLRNQILELESMEVGINFSTRSQAMDLVLVSTFKTEDDLSAYRFHPQHVEVLKYIDQVVEESKVVDYWV